MDEISTAAAAAAAAATQNCQFQNQFDRIPDDVLRLILNRVLDAKSLCACLAISKRFNSLVPHTNNISLHVDHIHFTDNQDEQEEDQASSNSKHTLLHSLVKLFITAPIRFLAKTISKAAARASNSNNNIDSNSVFYSPSEALRSFMTIEHLKIQLPSHGELQLDHQATNNSNPLLLWNATFGSQLKTCVIVAATSVESKTESKLDQQGEDAEEDSESLFLDCDDETRGIKEEESQERVVVDQQRGVDRTRHQQSRPLISNEDLKFRVVWTISCLIAASSRHHLLKRIVAEHPALKSIEMVDEERQGTLTMTESNIAEFRMRSGVEEENEAAVERTRVPALRMKMWYVPDLELKESGKVMRGATLVMIEAVDDVDGCGELLVGGLDGEMYREAAKEMRKMERSYSLEMESF